MATSGPGATNLVTGIATAYMDSVPVVAITANVTVPLLGKDSFQEIDIAGIAMPITKYSFIVKNIEELAPTLRRAFQIAQTGRPGPVLVDVTKDVTAAVTEYTRAEVKPVERSVSKITDQDIDMAVELLSAAKKPMIFVGGGAVISGASEELKKFVDLMDAPVTDTLMGKGAFDGEDSRYVGMLGMHGTKAANYSVTECDLLVAIGARFSDRVTGNAKKFAYNAKILHFDVDAAEINKNITVDASVIGDAKEILARINKKLSQQEHKEWVAKVQSLCAQKPLSYHKDVLTGPYIMEKLYEITGGDAIIVTEVGQHQMWAAQFYKYKNPRTLITSGGLGTMGYGLGAALGAKAAKPDSLVFNIAGDGCFRMNMNELATAVRCQIPVIEVVFNNSVLGMVRQWQTLFYGKRYSNTVLNDGVDFVKLAQAMGAEAFRITQCSEVEEVLKKAIALNKPVLIDCVIGSDDKVWPMVPPGAAIEEVFSEEDIKEA